VSLILILGGARSGKSRRAEAVVRELTGDRAGEQAGERVYLATSEPFDDEMRARIAQHRADRDADGWITVEEPLDLAGALSRDCRPGRVVLVECLTTWLGNLMHHERDVAAECGRLLQALPGLGGSVVFVANELGLGIVPENALARRFRDHAGRLNQDLAARAARVEFVAAGLPMVLKDQG